ncbi:hypothetical protein GCM10023093_12110 [Nemorincola caseinilytica]|uniref:Uncharacterized protein n=1 Tax=Nemorincola caseinilytica TaxID=2054315 RepID=A0ABP8NDI8_9BACT
MIVMRVAIFCVFIFIFSSCRKESNKLGDSGNVCTATLVGVKGTYGKQTLVRIDTNTGKGINSSFSLVTTEHIHGTAYNTKENAYYILERNSSDNKQLRRYDLFTHKTTIITYTGTNEEVRSSNRHIIFYNTFTNKLCMTFFDGNGDCLHELVINGITFDVKEILPSRKGNDLFPRTVDDNTGDIYFSSYDNYQKQNIEVYKQATGSRMLITEITGPSTISELNFNKNDNTLYGVRGTATNKGCEVVTIDVNNGNITPIISMTFDTLIASIFSTLDQCNNVLVVYNAHMVRTVNNDIFWVDLKERKVRKHLKPGDYYRDLTFVK